MYLVNIYNHQEDNQDTVIHSPFIDRLKVSRGKTNNVLGTIHRFNFCINMKYPAWNKIRPLQTLIDVTDVKRNKVVFEGRVLQPRSLMGANGMFHKHIVAESLLAYLTDSTQRHAEIHDTTIADFLQIIIDNHNSQVEPHKQVILGDVTVTNPTDNVYRYLGYENTYDTIKDKLVDRLGGYIQLRNESDGLYLDYLTDDTGDYIQDMPITLTKNMQSVSYEIDPKHVITRLVPLGEPVESEDEEATDASQARLTIANVNNGVDYLDDEDLIAEFGIIEKPIIWDDVTLPSRLMTNGLNFLRDQKAAISKFEVTTTNSQLLTDDLTSFEIGNYHDLINPIIDLNEKVQIIEVELDIIEPQRSNLKIGNKSVSLTEYQSKLRQTEKEVVELKGIVTNQTKRLANVRQEINNIDDELEYLQIAIGDANIPALENAIDNLNQAVSNLTDAIDNIPDYEPATETTDGLMSTTDKQKLNRITINQLIDLDNLLQRVIDLENEVFD